MRTSCGQIWLIVKSADGRLRRPRVLASRMRCSTRACARCRASSAGQIGVLLGREQRGVAVPVDVVERLLGAWMPRFAAHQHAGACRVRRHVHQCGDLGDVRAVSHLSVLTHRRRPVVGAGLGDADRRAHLLVEAGADGELHAGLAEVAQERVTSRRTCDAAAATPKTPSG